MPNAGFLANSGQVTGLSSAFRNVNNESGIIWWSNTGGAASMITGAYPALDTAIKALSIPFDVAVGVLLFVMTASRAGACRVSR